QMHLPALSRIVRACAREHGAPYVRYTLWGALRSHVAKLRDLGSAGEPARLGWREALASPSRFLRSRTSILLDATRKYGPLVRLPSLGAPMYIASDPSALRRILRETA